MSIEFDASADGATVFRGGTIWLGPHNTTSALAIRDGIILALGDDALALSDAKHVDLNGQFLMPAFSDGHCHPIFAGLEYQGPAISGVKDRAAVIEHGHVRHIGAIDEIAGDAALRAAYLAP